MNAPLFPTLAGLPRAGGFFNPSVFVDRLYAALRTACPRLSATRALAPLLEECGMNPALAEGIITGQYLLPFDDVDRLTRRVHEIGHLIDPPPPPVPGPAGVRLPPLIWRKPSRGRARKMNGHAPFIRAQASAAVDLSGEGVWKARVPTVATAPYVRDGAQQVFLEAAEAAFKKRLEEALAAQAAELATAHAAAMEQERARWEGLRTLDRPLREAQFPNTYATRDVAQQVVDLVERGLRAQRAHPRAMLALRLMQMLGVSKFETLLPAADQIREVVGGRRTARTTRGAISVSLLLVLEAYMGPLEASACLKALLDEFSTRR